MIDIFKDLPRICFGKRKNIPSGVVEDYLILEEFTKGFNQAERNNFEKIVKWFSWTSKSNSGVILPPCFGIFPLKENSDVLVMRFLDDGYDNQGRPDLLRVDCVKLPSSYIEDLKSEPHLLFSCKSWNMNFLEFTSKKELGDQESNQIIKCFYEKSKTPLIIGDPSNYTFKIVDGVLRTFNTVTKMDDEVSIEIKNPVLKPPTVANQSLKVITTQSSAFPIFKFLLVLGVLLGAGICFGYFYLVPKHFVAVSVLNNKQAELDNTNNDLTKFVERLKGKFQFPDDSLTSLECLNKIVTKLENNLKEEQGNKNRLEIQKYDLTNQIEFLNKKNIEDRAKPIDKKDMDNWKIGKEKEIQKKNDEALNIFIAAFEVFKKSVTNDKNKK